MSDIKTLTDVGISMGLEGADLKAYVTEQQAVERDERAKERDERAKERAERELERMAKEKELEHRKEQRAKERQDRLTEKEFQEREDKKRRNFELALKEKELEIAQAKAEATRPKVSDSNDTKAKPPKLPTFVDGKDDMDSYLSRFERFAEIQKWHKKSWPGHLSAFLSGKALEVYSRLDEIEAQNYDILKTALLRRYELNEEGFRNKLRTSKPEQGESSSQFVTRLRNYLMRWIDLSGSAKTFEELVDLLLREQFIQSSSKELAVYLKERSPKSVRKMATLAECYLEAHKFENKTVKSSFTPNKLANQKDSFTSSTKDKRCFKCSKFGHVARDCKSKNSPWIQKVASLVTEEVLQVGAATSDVKGKTCKTGNKHNAVESRFQSSNSKHCHCCECKNTGISACVMHLVSKTDQCVENGHLNLACGNKLPIITGACEKPHVGNSCKMPVVEGTVNGKKVPTLRDSGCSGIVVKSSLVNENQYTGKIHLCVLIDGTVKKVPMARIDIDTPYLAGKVDAMCMKNPVYDLVIGNVDNVRAPNDPDLNWKVKDECAVVTRAQAQRAKRPVQPLKVSDTIDIECSVEDFKREQHKENQFSKFFQLSKYSKVQKSKGGNSHLFLEEKGILYRIFTLAKTNTTLRQIMLPSKYRQKVLQVAHEIILAGHLGIKKTLDRILNNFYWPGIHGDVTRFIRSCDICQRTIPKGRVKKIPLGKMPVIVTPFEKIGVDLVGPISPVTNDGNRYMLSVVDYATRYPEIVPLKNIETVRVAEALFSIYSRLGIPKEVNTDMGSQFTSGLMKEVNRLLGIKGITTSPYHAMANGLVEKFHFVLKSMLRKLCQERPKDWDRYIPAVLFAYREVPQASLGFSPFELLFGRTVRGPITLLKELWTNEQTPSEVKTTYQHVLDLRNKIEQTCELAQKELSKVHEVSKKYYDRKTKNRKFKVGDKVLIMLPTDSNKLLMSWQGPYEVVEVLNPYDYRVKVRNRLKTYHANLLKLYVQRGDSGKQNSEEESRDDINGNLVSISGKSLFEESECAIEQGSVVVLEEESDRDGIGIHTVNSLATESYKDVKIDENLSRVQQCQVKQLLQEYSDIFTDIPGHTDLVEHDIKLLSDQPVRVKQYPIPYNLRQQVDQEIDTMLKLGIIKPCESPYSSPIMVTKKKDGNIRICFDARQLNKITVFDTEPMTIPDDIFSKLQGDKYFSKFDMTKGYHQISVTESSQPKTCFVTHNGSFCYARLPFGLVNSAATYIKMMRKLLKGVKNIENYIDDILAHTKTWNEHLQAMRRLFQRVREANLTLKPSKCQVGFTKLEYVGHQIRDGTIQPHPDRLAELQRAERPTTKKQVRSLMGLMSYYRKFVPNFATIAVPLTELTKKNQPNLVIWGQEQENAFQTLKSLLVKSPILRMVDFAKPFVIQCDASDYGVGAILLQLCDETNMLCPVAYASRKLTEPEKAYATIEKECLAIVWSIKKFATYLYGREFVLQTDHQPLTYLHSTKHSNSRLMRWALAIQPYRFRIQAIKGSENISDYLSRL